MGHIKRNISSKNREVSVLLCRDLIKPHLVTLSSRKRNSDWNKNSLNGWKNKRAVRHGETKTTWVFNCSHWICIVQYGVHAWDGKDCLWKGKCWYCQNSYKLAMNKFRLENGRKLQRNDVLWVFPRETNNPITFKLEQFVKGIVS